LRPGHAVARAEQRTAKPGPGPPGSPRAPARSGRPVLAGQGEDTSALWRGRGATGGAASQYQAVFSHFTAWTGSPVLKTSRHCLRRRGSPHGNATQSGRRKLNAALA
jgi:hypothetical protein